MKEDGGRTIAELFEKDHDEIDALLELVDFGDGAAALPRLKEFDFRLERHIVWEEDLLFPAAARAEACLAHGPIPVMLAEHVQIRAAKSAALEKLAKGDGAGARRHVDAMLAVLQSHNMKEEQMLYPACDRMIPPDEKRVILDALSVSPR